MSLLADRMNLFVQSLKTARAICVYSEKKRRGVLIGNGAIWNGTVFTAYSQFLVNKEWNCPEDYIMFLPYSKDDERKKEIIPFEKLGVLPYLAPSPVLARPGWMCRVWEHVCEGNTIDVYVINKDQKGFVRRPLSEEDYQSLPDVIPQRIIGLQFTLVFFTFCLFFFFRCFLKGGDRRGNKTLLGDTSGK